MRANATLRMRWLASAGELLSFMKVTAFLMRAEVGAVTPATLAGRFAMVSRL